MLISVFVSIANAVLLWLTLEKQKEAIEDQRKIFNQQSFENTFFKLLDSHRRVVKDLSIPSQGDYCKGIKCFEYACDQINLISESLKSNRYYDDESELKGKYDEKRSAEQEVDFDESVLNKSDSEYLLKCFVCKANKYYNISKDVWSHIKDMQLNENEKNAIIEKESIKFFFNRYQTIFEQYIRSLNLLKEYWESRATDEEKKKYKDIAFIHMPADESKFANWHLKYDGNCGRDKDKDKEA